MSIRGVCPECGTPVRATILARVDPYAGVLRPITYPVPTAAGVIVCSMFALVAALLTWYLRAADAYGVVLDRPVPTQDSAIRAACVCILLCALGAVALVRPHPGIATRRSLAAAAGILAIIAYAWVYWQLHAGFDPRHTRPYLNADVLLPERNRLRLMGSGLIIAAVLLLRPNIRLLASRSLVMRMGRVDRQTLAIVAVVVGGAALGDVLHLLAAGTRGLYQVLYTLGLFLIAVGSMFLTIGLLGVLVDCLRLVPVILRPTISLGQITGDTQKDAGP